MKFLIKNTSYWMIKNFDLLSIILVTCLTWLSRLELSKSIILKEPIKPHPIFVSHFVNDFPNGNLTDALYKFSKNDVILIYLYSHWDEESVSLKSVIENLAESIKYKVPVVALNCWNNQSSCHNTIKPMRFPQLYGFVSNYLLVEYKREINSNEIFKFANSLFYPFHFPKTLYELDQLIKLYDATFIACFNSQSPQFAKKVKIFHQLSSVYKGKGLNSPNIGFIVLSETDKLFNEIRQLLALKVDDAILYSITGHKVIYTGKFLVYDILKFLDDNSIKQTVRKYAPTGDKSINSQELLRDGVLILYIHNEKNQFIWSNVKARFDFYSIALQMRRCTSKEDWGVITEDLINFQRELLIAQYLQRLQDNIVCEQYSRAKVAGNSMFDAFSHVLSSTGNNTRTFYDYVVDPFVVSSNIMAMEWNCRKHSISADYDADKINLYLEAPSLRDSLHFDVAARSPCQENFNRSVNFAELDGSSYPKLLENWGLSADESVLPRILVIDWKNELVHHMQSPISQYSLNDLLAQMFLSNLTMHLKSEQIAKTEVPHDHFKAIDAKRLEQELMDQETDLVVYYYTPWCAYCSSLSNLLFMLSRYFSKYPSIHFSSLNTYNNDLPYKFQSERVPALIIYPRGRKNESTVFPISDEHISLSSLIRFVLENSGDPTINLNSPSVNYNEPHNVTCDETCLGSAQHTITELHRRLRASWRYLAQRTEDIRTELKELCVDPDFRMTELAASGARDWVDYHLRGLRARVLGRLVAEYVELSPRTAVLADKVHRLAKISRGMKSAAKEGDYARRSVEALARDIVTKYT